MFFCVLFAVFLFFFVCVLGRGFFVVFFVYRWLAWFLWLCCVMFVLLRWFCCWDVLFVSSLCKSDLDATCCEEATAKRSNEACE